MKSNIKMKKLILTLFVVASFSSISFAQLNLKAGINLANQTFEAGGISFEPDSKIGFLIGINYELSIAESISLRPGIQYSGKGSKIEILGTSSSASFNYIEVPVDFVYNTGNLSLHAGPYLGMLLSASSDGEDIKDEAKSTDFGINFGLGYNFGVAGVGLNYGLGLSNINDDGSDGSVKNKVISITFTYGI